VIRKRRQRVRDIVVAIDAGHGGDDPGAIGLRGTKEKHVVMKISRRLARMVNRQPGMRAVLIRQGDYYINLHRRQEIARKHRADVFISVHADAARRRGAKGVSVYTLSKRGASSQAAKWLADKENLSDLLGGEMHSHKGDGTLAKVLFDLSQTSTIHASRDVARSILTQLSTHNPVHGKGMGRAGFVVLKSPDIPSVLVETGFISNPYEESRLRRSKHQRKIARSIFKGLLSYFTQHAPPNTVFAKKRNHVVARGETLADVARKYRIKLSRLKSYNGLPNRHKVRKGDIIAIPFRRGS
jgi:N-acetylmuramoyl-L-alanine amidase